MFEESYLVVYFVCLRSKKELTEDKPEEEDETIPKVPSNKFLMRRSRTPSPVKEKREKARYARCIL